MMQGICNMCVIPVRSDPSDKSEMVTQLLFGELFYVNDTTEQWIKVTCVNDSYGGWIDRKQGCMLDEKEFEQLRKAPTSLVTDVVQLMCNKTLNLYFPLVIGCSLPGIMEKTLTIAGNDYYFDSGMASADDKINGAKVCEYARHFLNAPYLWGGRTPFGIDCSGLTQVTMKLCGVQIARNASQQALQGKPIDFLSEAMPGDLAFFENTENHIVHTGIILYNQKIIHASGKVRVDDIDHEGIFNNDLHCYTHKLRIIRRYI